MLDHLGDLKRSHTCGELTSDHIGQTVTLMGWVAKNRDLGNLTFVDVRDRWGMTQLVITAGKDVDAAVQTKAKALRMEFVIAATGVVQKREGATNPNLSTGEIEVVVQSLAILNQSAPLPFLLDDKVDDVSEELRLRHRYLDLRRPALQKNFLLRHKISLAVRNYLDERDFVDLETPILTKSSPEGARDYLVPSRVHPGKLYALPQSPQIFKQLFMVSGFERYYQICRCFRDEDLRADRQPEFTQVDVEMSFAKPEDIFELMEGMMKRVLALIDVDVQTPFERMAYREAMDRYGSDKPDLRFDVPLHDLSATVADCGFRVFSGCVADGGRVKGLCAPQAGSFSRKDIETLESWLKTHYKVKGLAWFKWTEDGANGGISKFLGPDLCATLVSEMGAEPGDLLLFVADSRDRANQALGALRNRLAADLNLIADNTYRFLWVTEFPLLEYDEEAGRYIAMHHPFTSPLEEDLERLKDDPANARARAYDLVMNGFEIGGGSIRIHRRDVQDAMFRALGLSEAEAEEKFGFLLNALGYGAPPHGGIALGLDRIAMLLAGEKSLRDVIAFPKTTAATCLMTQSPSEVSTAQLDELRLQFKK